jgi:hypothetical protein
MTGGAIAAGEGSEAEHKAVRVDAAHQALLVAITRLRGDMKVLATSEAVAAADGELAGIQDEITLTGRAEPGRLRRLLALLKRGDTILAALASAAAVAQAVQGLVG